MSNEGTFQAFRALFRGYTHWASGRIESIEANLKNVSYCHVRCSMKPSMKTGLYHIYSTFKEHKIGNISGNL